jgi:hypothetical protein
VSRVAAREAGPSAPVRIRHTYRKLKVTSLMKTFVLALLLLLTALPLAQSQPLRSGPAWAIHPQATPADWQALAPGENLVAGKLAAARPAPNCRDTGNDLTSLTDGFVVTGDRLFTDKRAVAWAYTDHVRLVFDLGEEQPVGRVVIRFQVYNKDNTLPRMITLGLSRDGDYYYPARHLIEKMHPDDNPAHTFDPLPADQPRIFALSLDAGYHARFVRLDLTTHGTLSTDEIAVLAGAGPLATLPPPPPHEPEYLDNTWDRRDQFAKLIAPGNLVLGKPLRFVPQPFDMAHLTNDDKDVTDLTDGKLSSRTDERLWFDRDATTWQNTPLVNIFADLGQPQPIGSVVARFQGGGEQNSILFPNEIRVLLSNDGENYYLVSARHKAGPDDDSGDAYRLPEENLAWVHNFVLPVGLKARYVALQVQHEKQFTCTDEIAVVRGRDALPAFRPDPAKLVPIVTSGVAFSAIHATLPICATLPLRTRVSVVDSRPGAAFNSPCTMILDLPAAVTMVTTGYTPTPVTHGAEQFQRYTIPCTAGKPADFYLQAWAPGARGTLYTYGDSGQGLENERAVPWEAIEIPPARVPQRLHISLAWMDFTSLTGVWPNLLPAMEHLGFNALGTMPRYWPEADVARRQELLQAGRDAGFAIILNEDMEATYSTDRNQPESKSQLPTGPSRHGCPSYRGQYWEKQLGILAQHAVWVRPDYLFYDNEAFWHGSQEAPNCSRCQARFKQDGFTDWDEFRAAMGHEMHVLVTAATEQALADAGVEREIVYGSYAMQPLVPLGDGVFRFSDLYPDLLQMAMPNLYVVGDQMKVARNISGNRAQLPANDIIPWFSTGTYGDYEPSRLRDMILEGFANGARGLTYYWYGDFDPAYFMYHAQAVDLVAPVEDLFMDGTPLTGLTCDNPKAKVCGMGTPQDLAVLVSNYQGLPAGTQVKVTTSAKVGTPVWDLHTGQRLGQTGPGGVFTVTLNDIAARMVYLGSTYAAAVTARP